MGKPDIDKLIDVLLHSKSDEKRLDAAIKLGTLREPRAVPALLQAAREGSSRPVLAGGGHVLYVQVEATKALGDIGGPEAVEALSKLLCHEMSGVQDTAIQTLKKLGTLDILKRYRRFLNQSWKALVMDGSGQTWFVGGSSEMEIAPGDYVWVEYSIGHVNRHGENWKAVVRGDYEGWIGIVDLITRKLCLRDTFNGYPIDMAGEPVKLLPAQKESLKSFFSENYWSRWTEEVENILR